MNTDETGILLRRKLREVGLNQADVSRLFGKSRAWASQELFVDPKKVLRRVLIEQPIAVAEFAKKLGWADRDEMIAELDLFESGADITVETDRGTTAAQIKSIPFRIQDDLEPLQYVTLPVYDMAQASRPIAELEPLPDYAPLNIPVTRFRSGTALFRVRGDSMTIGGVGGIMDGDVIYVDTHDVDPQPDRVFVIHVAGNGITLKRVRVLGGDFWLFSDNENQEMHPPFKEEDARIIGRVYDIWRRPTARL